MILREQMFEPLLEADPSFAGVWNAFLDTWKDEAIDLPHYIALSDLARHLVGKLECGDTRDFHKIFDVVERWHVEGDAYVRQAATIGLLESLQNTDFHERLTEPDDFVVWLGPQTKRWWDKVEAFWRDGTIIRDD
jgi:hypothetical protein